MPNGWVVPLQERPTAQVRLFCFPHAGAGPLAFRLWPDGVPATIEVDAIQLPGRESRFAEPPMTDLPKLIDALVRELYPYYLLRPFVFFGHSLGALVAFELARELRTRYGVQPVHLFVSGRLAPHVADPRPRIHDLPQPAFVEMLRTLAGTPDEILQNAELVQQFLPLLRADFALNETYVYIAAPPLDVPITALGGRDDPKVGEADLRAWAEQTSAACNVHVFEGGHFFLEAARGQVIRMILRTLGPWLG